MGVWPFLQSVFAGLLEWPIVMCSELPTMLNGFNILSIKKYFLRPEKDVIDLSKL
jgi:hypothetical protein